MRRSYRRLCSCSGRRQRPGPAHLIRGGAPTSFNLEAGTSYRFEGIQIANWLLWRAWREVDKTRQALNLKLLQSVERRCFHKAPVERGREIAVKNYRQMPIEGRTCRAVDCRALACERRWPWPYVVNAERRYLTVQKSVRTAAIQVPLVIARTERYWGGLLVAAAHFCCSGCS
jgi:hypothetical protein